MGKDHYYQANFPGQWSIFSGPRLNFSSGQCYMTFCTTLVERYFIFMFYFYCSCVVHHSVTRGQPNSHRCILQVRSVSLGSGPFSVVHGSIFPVGNVT